MRTTAGGLGQHQQDVWDHIKWNECDWATGLSSTHKPPTVSGLHREGQQGGIRKNCLQFTGWRLEAGVYLDLWLYDEEWEFMWSWKWSRHTWGSLKTKNRKHTFYEVWSSCFCQRQRTAWAQALPIYSSSWVSPSLITIKAQWWMLLYRSWIRQPLFGILSCGWNHILY